MNKRRRAILQYIFFLLCALAIGAYLLARHFHAMSQQDKVLASISHPTACSVLEKNNMLSWLLGPDNTAPSYQVAFKDDKTSKTESICTVYMQQGSSMYGGVLTLDYNYSLSKENIGTPYTENNNPAYFTEFQDNFYTGNVIVKPLQGVVNNNSKFLSGVITAAADANLPKNTGVQPVR